MKKRFVNIATITILAVTIIVLVKLFVKRAKKAFIHKDDEEPTGI